MLAEFAQGMQQELAKEIISARGNENTENNNQDKSTIAPWVLGIGEVVILTSLIGVIVIRQKKKKKNK